MVCPQNLSFRMSSQVVDTYYVRNEKVVFEEDLRTEFKGHRSICVEDLNINACKVSEGKYTRKEWSRYLCGMVNSGLGGTLYGGILDDGTVSGFMLTVYQKDHVRLALHDAFSRFSPAVPPSRYNIKFSRVLDPDEIGKEIVVHQVFFWENSLLGGSLKIKY